MISFQECNAVEKLNFKDKVEVILDNTVKSKSLQRNETANEDA